MQSHRFRSMFGVAWRRGFAALGVAALLLLPLSAPAAHAQQTASQQPVFVMNKSGGEVHLWFGHGDKPNAWLIPGGDTLWYVDLRAAGRDPSGVWDYNDQIRVNAQVRGAPDSARVTTTFSVKGRAKNMRVTWDGASLTFAADYLDASGQPVAPPAGAAAGSEAGGAGAALPAGGVVTEDWLNRLISLAGSGPKAAAVLAAIIALAVAAGIAISRLRGVPDADEEEAPEEDEEEEQAASILELTYPAGRSDLVFTSGWIFGARCILNPGTKDEVNVSEFVEWGGTGSFAPSIGATSRPSFEGEGANTITLSYHGRGQNVSRTFTVQAVSTDGYAAVGTKSSVAADAHGCPACPHPCIGPLVEGSSLVRIKDMPAGRVGDTGTHAACCDGNTFVVKTGDPRVLIDGRPAAWWASQVEHCGGMGVFVGLGHDAGD